MRFTPSLNMSLCIRSVIQVLASGLVIFLIYNALIKDSVPNAFFHLFLFLISFSCCYLLNKGIYYLERKLDRGKG